MNQCSSCHLLFSTFKCTFCNPIIAVSEDKSYNISQYESTTSSSMLILAVGIGKEAVSYEYLIQHYSLIKSDLLSEHK